MLVHLDRYVKFEVKVGSKFMDAVVKFSAWIDLVFWQLHQNKQNKN